MLTFSIRDLREHTGDLVRNAEQGQLAVVAKHGQPVFVAVPLDATMLQYGVPAALALKLFQEGALSLARAARLAGMSTEDFIDRVTAQGVVVVDYSPAELASEADIIG
jgi:prevent-host-death family protein